MSKKKTQTTTGARVTVYPRREILDPQGKAIARSLAELGFSAVASVRAGKSFELVLTGVGAAKAEKLAAEMAEKLLANPVVEDYTVELFEPDDEVAP